MDDSVMKVKSAQGVRLAMEPSMNRASSLQGKSVNIMGKRSLSRMKVRKQSYGFSGVPGVGGPPRRRSSQMGLEYKRPPLLYLNTYQLKPYLKFHVPSVTKAIDSVLDAYYNGTIYSIVDSPASTMLIADEVMRACKNMNFDRYRIISVVTIAQKRAQCYNNAVAFLWDHALDDIVDIHRENNTSFIQVTVFGVYLD